MKLLNKHVNPFPAFIHNGAEAAQATCAAISCGRIRVKGTAGRGSRAFTVTNLIRRLIFCRYLIQASTEASQHFWALERCTGAFFAGSPLEHHAL